MNFVFNHFNFFGVIAKYTPPFFSGDKRVFISSSFNIEVVGTYAVTGEGLPNFGVFDD